MKLTICVWNSHGYEVRVDKDYASGCDITLATCQRSTYSPRPYRVQVIVAASRIKSVTVFSFATLIFLKEGSKFKVIEPKEIEKDSGQRADANQEPNAASVSAEEKSEPQQRPVGNGWEANCDDLPGKDATESKVPA